MSLFSAKGYYEGTKEEWRKRWAIPLVAWVFIGLLAAVPFGTIWNYFSLIFVVVGLQFFVRNYACGIGVFGLATHQKPAEFWGEEKKTKYEDEKIDLWALVTIVVILLLLWELLTISISRIP